MGAAAVRTLRFTYEHQRESGFTAFREPASTGQDGGGDNADGDDLLSAQQAHAAALGAALEMTRDYRRYAEVAINTSLRARGHRQLDPSEFPRLVFHVLFRCAYGAHAVPWLDKRALPKQARKQDEMYRELTGLPPLEEKRWNQIVNSFAAISHDALYDFLNNVERVHSDNAKNLIGIKALRDGIKANLDDDKILTAALAALDARYKNKGANPVLSAHIIASILFGPLAIHVQRQNTNIVDVVENLIKCIFVSPTASESRNAVATCPLLALDREYDATIPYLAAHGIDAITTTKEKSSPFTLAHVRKSTKQPLVLDADKDRVPKHDVVPIGAIGAPSARFWHSTVTGVDKWRPGVRPAALRQGMVSTSSDVIFCAWQGARTNSTGATDPKKGTTIITTTQSDANTKTRGGEPGKSIFTFNLRTASEAADACAPRAQHTLRRNQQGEPVPSAFSSRLTEVTTTQGTREWRAARRGLLTGTSCLLTLRHFFDSVDDPASSSHAVATAIVQGDFDRIVGLQSEDVASRVGLLPLRVAMTDTTWKPFMSGIQEAVGDFRAMDDVADDVRRQAAAADPTRSASGGGGRAGRRGGRTITDDDVMAMSMTTLRNTFTYSATRTLLEKYNVALPPESGRDKSKLLRKPQYDAVKAAVTEKRAAQLDGKDDDDDGDGDDDDGGDADDGDGGASLARFDMELASKIFGSWFMSYVNSLRFIWHRGHVGEKRIREALVDKMVRAQRFHDHAIVPVADTGFWTDDCLPFIGTSPDGFLVFSEPVNVTLVLEIKTLMGAQTPTAEHAYEVARDMCLLLPEDKDFADDVRLFGCAQNDLFVNGFQVRRLHICVSAPSSVKRLHGHSSLADSLRTLAHVVGSKAYALQVIHHGSVFCQCAGNDEEPPAHGVLFVRGHEDGGDVVIVFVTFSHDFVCAYRALQFAVARGLCAQTFGWRIDVVSKQRPEAASTTVAAGRLGLADVDTGAAFVSAAQLAPQLVGVDVGAAGDAIGLAQALNVSVDLYVTALRRLRPIPEARTLVPYLIAEYNLMKAAVDTASEHMNEALKGSNDARIGILWYVCGCRVLMAALDTAWHVHGVGRALARIPEVCEVVDGGPDERPTLEAVLQQLRRARGTFTNYLVVLLEHGRDLVLLSRQNADLFYVPPSMRLQQAESSATFTGIVDGLDQVAPTSFHAKLGFAASAMTSLEQVYDVLGKDYPSNRQCFSIAEEKAADLFRRSAAPFEHTERLHVAIKSQSGRHSCAWCIASCGTEAAKSWKTFYMCGSCGLALHPPGDDRGCWSKWHTYPAYMNDHGACVAFVRLDGSRGAPDTGPLPSAAAPARSAAAQPAYAAAVQSPPRPASSAASSSPGRLAWKDKNETYHTPVGVRRRTQKRRSSGGSVGGSSQKKRDLGPSTPNNEEAKQPRGDAALVGSEQSAPRPPRRATVPSPSPQEQPRAAMVHTGASRSSLSQVKKRRRPRAAPGDKTPTAKKRKRKKKSGRHVAQDEDEEEEDEEEEEEDEEDDGEERKKEQDNGSFWSTWF